LAVLIVLCPDPAEAAKCRQLIRTGHPGFDLAPIVIDSSSPPGRDGTAGPYLTVFAASMGGIDLESEPGARRVLDAMASAEVEGEAKGKAEAVVRLLEARHLNASQEQRAQVMSCTDAAKLDLWFDRAITVQTAAEVFAD
jgi:hypothetical protein